MASVKCEGSRCAGIMKRPVPLRSSKLGSCSWEVRVTLDVMSLAYAPVVSVFPARSGFTPGWVYVHVCGGTHCSCCPVLFLTVCSCFLLCTCIGRNM